METNELKSLWEDYNKKISQSLKLNKQLLIKMTQEKTKKELRKLIRWEYLNLFFFIILIPLIITWTILLSHTLLYLVTGIISSILFTIYFILYLQQSRRISKIDFYKDSIYKLQKSIAEYEKHHNKIKKIELLTFPITVISFVPIFLKIARNQHIFSMPTPQLIWGLLLGLGLGYVTMFMVYKHIYEEKFNNINIFLKDLEEFEKE